MAQLAVFAVIFAVMYGFLILPQQRRQKKTQMMISALEEGDEVLLTSGIFGFITALDPTTVWIEVAPDIELKVTRNSVAGLVADDESVDAETN